jgi:hypothetical protein
MKKILADILTINWLMVILGGLLLICLKAAYDIGRGAGKKDAQTEKSNK